MFRRFNVSIANNWISVGTLYREKGKIATQVWMR